MTRPRATASPAQLAAFEAAVSRAVARGRPSGGADLLGFSIDLSVALDRFGARAPRPNATGEPRRLLSVRAEISDEAFASRSLRARLRRLFERELRYRFLGAHVVVVEARRALLRFVTTSGEGPRALLVTGAIEAVPRAARLRRGRRTVHGPAR